MTVPTALYVPIPNGNFLRRYGVYSTRHPDAGRVTVRMGVEQHAVIKQAAGILNMSEAEFIREGVASLARALIKHMEEHNADASTGDG